MEPNWDSIREKYFPALKKFTYLMAAAASPLNTSAYDNAIKYFNEMLNFGDLHNETFFMEIQNARIIISEYLNAKPQEIAFMINTSSGMTTVAHLFENEKGEILYPSIEFPASVHIFKRMGFPCKKVIDNNNKYLFEDFKKELTENTKYLIHSHVQSFNGFRQNLDKLGNFCRENNLISIINATQSFGSFEIDVKKQNIDILVSSALKWIGCGFGIGILYIKENLIEERSLPFTSWLSVVNPLSMDNENLSVIKKTLSMDSFGGCPNFPALFCLKGSLDLIKDEIGDGSIQVGVKKIQERVIFLTSEFIKDLKNLDFKIITPLELEYRSGIITVEHEKARRIYQHLTKNNIHVTLKKYPRLRKHTLIRFAINYYNNLEDLNHAIKVLKEVL